MNLKEFGAACRDARQAKNQSTREVSSALGYHMQAITSVELGSVHTLFDSCRLAMADHFDLPLPDGFLERR